MRRPTRLTKLDSLRDWIKHAVAGSRIAYHEGNLAYDRLRDEDLDFRARLLWAASEVYGTVYLTQQRINAHEVRYIATKGGGR